jgi:hypothetical protein
LADTINHYGFFSYSVSEALFLSRKEKAVVEALFATIAAELENNIDHFSQDILVSQLALLLNHSNRYYARQFITRKTANNELIAKLDSYLDRRFGWKGSSGTVDKDNEFGLPEKDRSFAISIPVKFQLSFSNLYHLENASE